MCEKYVLFLLCARQKLRTTLIVFFFREGHFFYSKSKSNFELRFTMCDFKYEYKGLDLSLESTLEDLTSQATGGRKRGNV